MSSDLLRMPFNPFVDRAVGDPWNSPEPDIKTINAKPHEAIKQLLRQIDKTRHVAALVMGEAGSGKTHLIKRLMNEQDLDLVFVYVHPIKDYRTMFSSLLEKVMANLDHASPPAANRPDGATQLDLVVIRVICAAIEHFLTKSPGAATPSTLKSLRKDPWKVLQVKPKKSTWDGLLRKSRTFLAEQLPSDRISKMVLNSLFQYLDKSKRDAVQVFLSGYLPDDEDASALGLRFGEIDATVEAQEDRSKRILKAVGRLLRFYKPMILCFDQLENLDTDDLVHAFGTLISDIVNEVDHVLPVCFMRPDTLESNFSQGACDKSALDRLMSNAFVLEGCDLTQALDMVKARLDWAYEGSDRPHPFHPFNEDVLRGKILKDGNTPRQVLTTAAKLLGAGFTPQDPVMIVQASFSAEREKLIGAGYKEPFSKQTVLEALKLYFADRGAQSPYRVLKTRTEVPVDLHLVLEQNGGNGETILLDLVVEPSTHGATLVKRLARLTDRIASGKAHHSFFIREADSPIPPHPGRMPKTVEQLEKFRAA
ncbi:MAG: AAA family ATPase, partial [Pseudomonadota bacterium]